MGSRQTSCIHISIPTLTLKTTFLLRLRKAISVSPSSSLLDRRTVKRLPRIQVMLLLQAPASSAVKPLEISSGPSPIRVSSRPFTSCLSPLQTLPISPSSRYQSQIQMLRSGACSTLPMLATIFLLNASSLARFRRIPPVQTVEAPESASLARRQKRKLSGRPLVKATRTASNGLSSVRP